MRDKIITLAPFIIPLLLVMAVLAGCVVLLSLDALLNLGLTN